MSNCANCGSKLKPGASYCGFCGTRVEPPAAEGRPGRSAAGSPQPLRRSEASVRSGLTASPQRVSCPGCGAQVQPGSRICAKCGAVLFRQPIGSDGPGTDSDSRTGSGRWIALASLGVLILVGAALLLIFWNDLFGAKREAAAPAADHNYAEPAVDGDRSDRDDRSDEAEALYSWEEIRARITERYAGNVRLSDEDESYYYAEVLERSTGVLTYVLRADKRTGEIKVTSDYSGTADLPPADGVPEAERTNIAAVRSDTVDSYMTSLVPDTVYAFTVVDLKTGESAGSGNQDAKMSSSVLIGVPVMYAVNRLVQDGELRMSDRITIRDLGGGGRGSLTSGQMTVEELLQYMLRASSGAAINNLAYQIGMDRINSICRNAGYSSVSYVNYIASAHITDYTASDNYVSTKDVCGMICELYNGSGPIDSSFLRNNFGVNSGTDQNDGLGKHIQGTIGSFNGRKESKYNDLILVERDSKAYAVVMMAHGSKYAAIMDAMDSVGKYIDGVLIQ